MNYYVTLSQLRTFECRADVYNQLAIKHFSLDESDPAHWIRENGCIKLPLELREHPISILDIRKHLGTYTALWALRAVPEYPQEALVRFATWCCAMRGMGESIDPNYPPERLALHWRGKAYNTRGVDGALLTAKTLEVLKGEF